MSLSKHAQTRMRQRGFHELELDLILSLGHQEPAPGGATRYVLKRKDMQEIRRSVDRMSQGGVAIVGKEGVIRTVFKRRD